MSTPTKFVNRSKDPRFMGQVLAFAEKTYGEKALLQGKTYLHHALSVAELLQAMKLDDLTVATALLHDAANPSVTEDRQGVLEKIEQQFGSEIAGLVKKNYELHKIYYSFAAKQETAFANPEKLEKLRRMFLAIAGDVRVILIELAARMEGLRHINELPKEKQISYAKETLEIFVPIANRLGLGEIKRNLEDPAFAILLPEKFAWLQENLQAKYEERQKYLKHFIPRLKKILRHEHILFSDIHFRPKSYWSSYQKLERHHMDFEKLHDLVAVRVIVKDVAACYKTLGILHKHFRPMSGHIQDYIAKPKENGYQSLHTTVVTSKDQLTEIQIKTEQMYQEAEHGICAHWAYKEKINLNKEKVHLQWAKEIPNFLKTYNIDFFQNQVFAFTPKGDVMILPKQATPVDFAYAIHSSIGDHCEGAKINGKMVPLSEPLHNGDIVEIITNKKRLPSADWLQFVTTSFAKANIRKATSTIIKYTAAVPSYIGKKILGFSQITKKKEKSVVALPPTKKPSQIYLAGQKGIKTTMAKCCSVTPGQAAKGYVTTRHAAIVHHPSCKNLQRMATKFPEKILEATWEQS